MTVRVLLITNHPSERTCPGQVDGLRQLVVTNEITGLDVVHAGLRHGESSADNTQKVVAALRASSADIAIVLSPKERLPDVSAVARALAGRPLLYWEGDSYGRRKPMSASMTAWLQLSDLVYSVAGEPQIAGLRRAGAREIVQTVHTYDHILFAEAEQQATWNSPHREVIALGNNLLRFPLVGGLPGSHDRRRLMGQLRHSLGDQFSLAGRGWPRRWEIREVPYADQIGFIQSGRLMANWDHFPGTASYTSDRMAIAMIAARPQVTTWHADMPWLPGPEDGLFLAKTPRGLLDEVSRLGRMASSELRNLGERSHAWVRDRLSHREAMRFILSGYVPDVAAPQGQPWDSLRSKSRSSTNGDH